MSLRHGKHGSEVRGPAMQTEPCLTRELHKRESFPLPSSSSLPLPPSVLVIALQDIKMFGH